ncbi:hypothetical protein Harman_32090 [Haloarcula mannanilytica]|uniref:Histidine kinase/HSP90-like ATPase domain-containing protein n=1 Tax=Haloarcula mannanilytica TaxID=2509225 RepID=A0A4C2EL56_9EURY|nr:hypothetical protein Harman_32090 [Haloarcula mannanilytica]
MFDMRYTTHDEGTGLGLNIVRDIASAHEWPLVLTESATGGARFEFRDVDRDSSRPSEDDTTID